MSQSKDKISKLHRKFEIEREAKEKMYRIAVDSIKAYLQAIDKAGKLLDKTRSELISNSIRFRNIELKYLGNYKDFVVAEANRSITFREYLERRTYGHLLTLIIDWLFGESFRKRFIEKNKDIDQDFNASDINYEEIKSAWNYLTKEVQKFHIMQDILSETKTTEAAMLQKYNLQRDELITIIEEIKKELRGIETKQEPQLETKPIGENKS